MSIINNMQRKKSIYNKFYQQVKKSSVIEVGGLDDKHPFAMAPMADNNCKRKVKG